MSHNIKISKVAKSKVEDLDFNNIPLGRTFTDHMFICDYESGQWNNPRVEPLELIPTHPAAMALHYGQAIFEGMKATVDSDGTPMLFRPAKNAARLSRARYDGGVVDYLEVLDTERTLFDAELAESQKLQLYFSAIVRLYAALGGGWSVEK